MNKQRQKEKIVKAIKNSTASKKLSSEDICVIAEALIKADFAEMKSFAEYIGGTIAGHSNYHGDTILSALYCAAEGKEIDYLKPLNITEYGYKEAIKAKQELQDEIARLTAENAELKARLEKAVELPCKCEDTLYCVHWSKYNPKGGIITEEFVHKITLNDRNNTYTIHTTCNGIWTESKFVAIDFGDILFADRSKAEARLAELRGGEQE